MPSKQWLWSVGRKESKRYLFAYAKLNGPKLRKFSSLTLRIMVQGEKVEFAGAINEGKRWYFLISEKRNFNTGRKGKASPQARARRNALAAKAINSTDRELPRKFPVHFFKSILERRPKELQVSGPHYLEVNNRTMTQLPFFFFFFFWQFVNMNK